MPTYIMPHDQGGAEELASTPVKPYVMPHEQEKPEPSPAELALAEESPLSRLMIGAGKGYNDKWLGAKQKAGMVRNLFPGKDSTLPQDIGKEVTNQLPYTKAIANDPWARTGQILADTTLGLLGPTKGAFWQKGSNLIPTVSSGMITGGALNALNPQARPDWGESILDIGKGALWGGAGLAGVNSVASQVARARNMAHNRFANPEWGERYRIFKQEGVPASLGDLTQDHLIQNAENLASYVPLTGRNQFLGEQSKAMTKAIENAPRTVAGATSNQSKEQVGDVIANSIKNKYKSVKDQATALYDDVGNRVIAAGNPVIQPTRTAAEVNTLLSSYPSTFAKLSDDPKTLATLESIAKGTSPTKSMILGPNGQPMMNPPQLTFSDLRELDSGLGAMIRQGRALTTKGELNNKSFDQLVKVQKALRDDVTSWSQAVGDPQIASGVARANKFFRDEVMPFRKNRVTRKVIQDGDYNPDTLASTFFRTDQPYTSDQALRFMTPEGIQAGRYHLINEARRRAMDEAVTSGFDPHKFIRSAQLGETGPKLFTPDELSRLDDLRELAFAGQRGAKFDLDPSQTNRWALLSPLFSWKIPIMAKTFSTLSSSDKPIRFMLSSPYLYNGQGALGRASENILRKSGTGLGEGTGEVLNEAR